MEDRAKVVSGRLQVASSKGQEVAEAFLQETTNFVARMQEIRDEVREFLGECFWDIYDAYAPIVRSVMLKKRLSILEALVQIDKDIRESKEIPEEPKPGMKKLFVAVVCEMVENGVDEMIVAEGKAMGIEIG